MNSIIQRVAIAALLASCAGIAQAQVSITATGSPVTQDFNALPASGTATWANNVTLPGVYHARTGTGTTVVANDGTGTGGNLYSYGSGTASERALGSLGSGNAAAGSFFWGLRLRNDTGETLRSLEVSFVGEQWRNSAAAAQAIGFSYVVGAPSVGGLLADFQAAGTAVPALSFTSPITGGTAAALNGNLAANRVALSATITGLSIPAGTEILLRWSDPDHTGADHGLAIDDVVVTAQGDGPSLPALSVGDVSLSEGDAGSSIARFTLSLSNPGTGPITFDIGTADGSASAAGGDYRATVATGRSVDAADFPISFDVEVFGDTTVEPNESFFLNVTNVVGANVADGQGQATIVNDDFVLTPIHDIQGPGASSPIVGAVVHTTGIVTGRKSNGFFLQAPDAEVDADPATSEGVFVFTGAAPGAAAAVGNRVRVSGTVIEFVPASDPGQAPLTEIGGSPTVALLDAPATPVLPTPIALTANFPSPEGPLDQLERVEGMLVTIPEATVVAPTQGFTNEANATGTGNGQFSVVVAGVRRPFREPGIQAPDSPPGGGSIPPIPRWDFNPELIAVDSDALGAPARDLSVDARLAGMTGPLDYAFRRYTVLPSPLVAYAVEPGAAPRAAAAPADPRAVTIAAYNLERFFDTVNDPAIGETVLTAAAFERRLQKASLGIREFLRTPDILATVEVENLSTLQTLADRINADAVTAGRPDPRYVPYLVEGNDVGGIDVGFLVSTAPVADGVPRVEVSSVIQVGKDTLWTEPDGGSALLNDRPPLALDAVVHHADGTRFPVSVVAVHQRSLNGAETNDASGNRIRGKRQRQAEFLAAYLDTRQKNDPSLRLVVLGDFNAFEFNDGLAHTMGTVTGRPAPDAETAVLGDGADLVEPDLVNLGTLEPEAERYSFVFGGNAQTLDHVLVNEELVVATRDLHLDHARINADFPEINRSDAASPSRLADHDPVLVSFVPRRRADLMVAVSASDVAPGAPLVFLASVRNDGPEQADEPMVAFEFDAALPGVSVQAAAGWTCSAPAVVAVRTTLECTRSALEQSAVAEFRFSVATDLDMVGRSISLTAVVEAISLDPVPQNNAATSGAQAALQADLSVQLVANAATARPGQPLVFFATLRNRGPESAIRPRMTFSGEAAPGTVAVVPPAGWSCANSAEAPGFVVRCSASAMANPSQGIFTVRMPAPARTPAGTMTFRANAGSASSDPRPADNEAAHAVRIPGSAIP